MRIFLFLALAIFSSPAQASPNCDDVANQLMEKAGAAFVRRSDLMKNYFLSHPAVDDVVVMCGTPTPAVAITKDGSPTADYLRFSTLSGWIVSGVKDEKLPAAIAQCLKMARRAKDEMAEIDRAGIHIECQSFVRDGGGNHITISAQ